MMMAIPQLLDANELATCRALMAQAQWASGALTAGTQSSQVKNNRQLPEDAPEARMARELVLGALQRNALFFSAALPKKIYPPLFNRYDGTANAFGNHIDNAMRGKAHPDWVRTDLSMTVFLADVDEYEGGELIVEDTYGHHSVKLPAGDAILYPSSSVHRVEPVTAGARIASFFWIESMVRTDERRRLLFDLDVSIVNLRNQRILSGHAEDGDALVQLTGCYHNLLRMWADS
jgi:PKHD-type hydroxylase